jgi:hypothetical protein
MYSKKMFLHLVCEVQSLIVKKYLMLHETENKLLLKYLETNWRSTWKFVVLCKHRDPVRNTDHIMSKTEVSIVVFGLTGCLLSQLTFLVV